MTITFPHFIFGSLIAALLGALIHLVLGGKPLRLIFALIFAWIGFWTGHFLGNRYQIFFLRYGVINIGVGAVTALGLSLLGYWIAGENKKDA